MSTTATTSTTRSTTKSTRSTTGSHPDQLEDLRATIRGDVFLPGDPRYLQAVTGFNLLMVQRPRIVLVAGSGDDVAAGVRFAARCGLPVAVQATGHGTARAADDALLINTSRLTDVRIDPVARTAEVGAGALWSAVLEPAQQFGLAPLMGSSSTVGAVGYTLGGGFGWLGRRHGLGSDSVLSFDLVTPDGRELTASAEEHPELFWALKGGGGGSLGVVTRMRIRLYPVREVYAGNLLYPAELAGDVLRRWRDWAPATSTELTSAVTLMNFPPLPMVPEPLRGKSFVMVRGCWSGDLAEGERVLSFWREWRTPALDMFAPMPFAAVDMISQDPQEPMPAHVSSEWFDRLPDAAVDAIVDAAFPLDHAPLVTMTEVRNAGGMIRAGADAAVNDRGRSGEFLLQLVGTPPTPELVPLIRAYVAVARAELAPYVTGASYLNFLEGPQKQERTAAAFSPGHRERLAAVKRVLDPDNRFAYGLRADLIVPQKQQAAWAAPPVTSEGRGATHAACAIARRLPMSANSVDRVDSVNTVDYRLLDHWTVSQLAVSRLAGPRRTTRSARAAYQVVYSGRSGSAGRSGAGSYNLGVIFKAVGDGRPYPDHGYATPKQWSAVPPRQVRLDELVTTKRTLDLDALLSEDSTFYGDLFAHVIQWQDTLYLEDGLHRAVRAALAQRPVLHARVLVLDDLDRR